MLVSKQPFSRYAFAFKDKEVTLSEDIVHLVEDALRRMEQNTLFEIVPSYYSDIFQLRLRAVKAMKLQEKGWSVYFEKLNIAIAEKMTLSAYSDLAKSMSNVLLLHEKIAAPIVHGVIDDASMKSVLGMFGDVKMEYTWVNILLLHPSKKIQYIKNWLDASLSLDLGLALADFALNDKISITEKQAVEIKNFLVRMVVRYGAYSIFTGFWQPSRKEIKQSSLINKMSILAATIELDNEKHNTYSVHDLEARINHS